MGLQINTRRTEGAAMPEQVRAETRVYRTSDGEFVAEGDPRAAVLAYPVGEPVAARDVDAYRALVEPAPQAGKRASRPADKSAAKPADK